MSQSREIAKSQNTKKSPREYSHSGFSLCGNSSIQRLHAAAIDEKHLTAHPF